MERKQFIKVAFATTGLVIANPFSILDIFDPEKDVMLPFLDGKRSVTLLKPKVNAINTAHAQVGGYYGNYNYGNLAPYQQWHAYQQALAEWNARMQYWQQQQYYAWLQQAHIQRMQAALNHYSNYQHIGDPQVWPQVRSIYAYAKDNYNQPTLFGINQSRQEVAIKDNLEGAAKIWNAVNQHYTNQRGGEFGSKEAQKTVGPQSSETNAAIRLPDNSIKIGKKYNTANGIVAISNPNEQVRDNNTGQVGRLAKFVTGPDGEQYAVV
jgi:hypothetical protein